MSSNLVKKICHNHPQREAVAKCPICDHFYCRECVTEHDSKFVCVGCLSTISKKEKKSSNILFKVVRLIVLSIFSILTAWYFFNIIGSLLLKIPSSFS